MSNKIDPQHHKDINELIAEKKEKERQEALNKELKRQQEFLKEFLIFFNDFSQSISDAKILINNTIKTLKDVINDKMKEENERLSQTPLEKLDIDERLERDERFTRQRSILQRFKDEKIGTTVSMLSALHMAIAEKELKENDKRKLNELNIEV